MSENHEITRQYNEILRKVKETDEVHADFVNTIYSQLINNDAYLKAQDLITENNVKQYVDQQIQLVTETGIPKLMCYSYLLKATEDNQTVFEIPLSTFDKNTYTVFVIQNTSFRNEEEHYSIEGSTITLNEGVRENTSIVILILKNVPIGEEGSVSGKVIADGSLELKKLDTEVTKKEDFNEHLAKGATKDKLGHVKIGEGISVDTNGLIKNDLKFKFVTFTRNMELPNSEQYISVGFRPKSIIMIAIVSGVSGVGSWGFMTEDHLVGGGISYQHHRIEDYFGFSNAIFMDFGNNPEKIFSGNVTKLDNNGFSINWNRIGDVTGILSCRALVIGW